MRTMVRLPQPEPSVMPMPNSTPPSRKRGQGNTGARYGGRPVSGLCVSAMSASPRYSSIVTPATATAMPSTQARMRPLSPMLTRSETAPMVQKLVLYATAPSTSAIRKPASST